MTPLATRSDGDTRDGVGRSPYRGPVDRCVACGADLGVGRFCLNCGHPIGAPAPVREAAPAEPPSTAVAPDDPKTVDEPPAEHAIAPPVQAADPTPVAPTSPPDLPAEPDEPDDRTTGTTTATARALGPTTEPATEPDPGPDDASPPPPRPEWDPREDLLPYEEVDDLDSDAPIRGRAWMVWVGGALLLIGLVVVLLRVFATDGEDVATDPSGSGSTSAGADDGAPADEADDGSGDDPEAPRGVGPRTELATGATFEVPGTGPPTTDFDGNLVAYEASQMADGNPTTTWRTEGDATGQTVTVTLPQPGVVTRVGLVNGYAKQVAGVDWYPNNRRILAVTWGFDDGTSVEQTFAERPAMQRLKVPPVQTATLTITITSVTPPGAGNLGRDYTAISEVSVIGRQAG
ncbi:hypothetical protein GCM10023339_68930 [Alloalcanivorax gelatiniphagus]